MEGREQGWGGRDRAAPRHSAVVTAACWAVCCALVRFSSLELQLTDAWTELTPEAQSPARRADHGNNARKPLTGARGRGKSQRPNGKKSLQPRTHPIPAVRPARSSELPLLSASDANRERTGRRAQSGQSIAKAKNANPPHPRNVRRSTHMQTRKGHASRNASNAALPQRIRSLPQWTDSVKGVRRFFQRSSASRSFVTTFMNEGSTELPRAIPR